MSFFIATNLHNRLFSEPPTALTPENVLTLGVISVAAVLLETHVPGQNVSL